MAKSGINRRVEAEKRRMDEIFSGVDENKRRFVTPLIDRAAFIIVSLQDLEKELAENGWTDEYQNGRNQSGSKPSAAANAYSTQTKNLNMIVKQLIDLVPASQKASKLDELMNA